MKKGLLIVGVLAIAVVVLFFIPIEIKVEESHTFKTGRSVVHENVSKFEEFKQWSPWAGLDPSQETSIAGEDGQVGATFSWTSNSEEVGTGSQTIKSITNDRIDLDLKFTAPWQSESKVYWTFADADGGTKVTWGMEAEGNLMMKLIIVGSLSEQYQKGFANLEKHLEGK